MNLSEKEK
jgi:NIMA (never in mitosis gene a)-related kinase